MKATSSWGLVAIAAVLFLIFLAAYVVQEAEQVIITQFGKPVGEPVIDPGIHFKLPFIQKANYFEKRFLEWDGDPNQVPTKDKRFIWVDTYARWQISDPLLFFQRLRDERGAQSRLDDILDGEVRNAIANHKLVEIVRSTNRDIVQDDELSEDEAKVILAEIIFGRKEITKVIFDSASQRITESDLGIEILDFRIKRIDYVEEVRRKVFERMISERQRIADKYRSEGHGEASKILGERDRELKRIQSEAYRDAQEIKGEADAEAARIYADAYDQSVQSRDFYQFIKTMETYQSTVDKETRLILSTEGEFYRFLQEMK